jgi:rSAM/selenodomain-associated transferase 1
MKPTAIALLAKAPIAGKVKTRFCPPCTPDEAAQLARAFLEDTAAMLATPAIASQVDSWCSYLGDADLLHEIFGAELLEQRGSNFGERIANATEDLFDMGYVHVVALCADCPTVDATYFTETLMLLPDNDVVFGPARDGGCVHVAMSLRAPEIFRDVEMSTDHVLADMQRIAIAKGLSFVVQPERFDLDVMVDLRNAVAMGELALASKTLKLLNSTTFAEL